MKKPSTVVIYEDEYRKVYMSGLQAKSKNIKTGAMVQVFILAKGIHPIEAARTGADSAICGDCIHRQSNPAKYTDEADSIEDILAHPDVIECPNATHHVQCVDCCLCDGASGSKKHIAIKSHGAGRKSKSSCYVELWRSPSNVYLADERGNIPEFGPEHHESLEGKAIRWGAYGDPCYIPIPVIKKMEAISGMIPLRKNRTGYTHQWRNPMFQGYRHYFMASCDNINDYLAADSLGWRAFIVGE